MTTDHLGKMPPTTNFRTYEAQARLLAALLASLDDRRLDYKSKSNTWALAHFIRFSLLPPLELFLSLLWSFLLT